MEFQQVVAHMALATMALDMVYKSRRGEQH